MSFYRLLSSLRSSVGFADAKPDVIRPPHHTGSALPQLWEGLGRGIVWDFNGDARPLSKATSAQPVIDNNVTFSQSTHGRGALFPSGTDANIDCTSLNNLESVFDTEGTIAIVWTHDGTTNSGIAYDNRSGGGDGIELGINDVVANSVFVRIDSGAFTNVSVDISSASAGELMVAVARWDGATVYLNVRGYGEDSASHTGNSAGTVAYIGNQANFAIPFGDDRELHLFVISDRCWAEGEVKALFRNPFGMLMPAGGAPLFRPAAGGGSTFEESISLGVSAAVSAARNADLAVAMSLGVSAGVSDGSALDAQASASLGALAGISADPQSVIDAVATLAAQAGVSAERDATIEAAAVFAVAAALQMQRSLILAGTVTLPVSAGVSPDSILTAEAVITLGASLDLAVATEGQAFNESISLAVQAALATDRTVTFDGVITLGVSGDMASAAQLTIPAQITLAADMALAFQTQLNAHGSVTLSADMGLTVTPPALAQIIRRLNLTGEFSQPSLRGEKASPDLTGEADQD